MAQPLLLQGAPYERGLAHGETLRSQIHEAVGRWKGEVAHMYQMDADEVIARLVAGTDFVPAIQRWTPDLLDEIRGIAVGADMAWETIGICCNALVPLCGCSDGLPVACVVRGVLQQQTVQQAVAFLQAVRRGTGPGHRPGMLG
jgi:hypothetical protein